MRSGAAMGTDRRSSRRAPSKKDAMVLLDLSSLRNSANKNDSFFGGCCACKARRRGLGSCRVRLCLDSPNLKDDDRIECLPCLFVMVAIVVVVGSRRLFFGMTGAM